MRSIAKLLLLVLAFTIPWEFSIELTEPFGPVARIVGILLLAAAVPAVLETGRVLVAGSGQDLLDDPQVRKAYLGVSH